MSLSSSDKWPASSSSCYLLLDSMQEVPAHGKSSRGRSAASSSEEASPAGTGPGIPSCSFWMLGVGKGGINSSSSNRIFLLWCIGC